MIQAAAKRAKLKREDVQRFLSDCAWPEEKPVPQVQTGKTDTHTHTEQTLVI